MHTIIYRNSSGAITRNLAVDDIKTALIDLGGLLWVDISDPATDEWKKILVDVFNFHPLAVEDAIQDVNHPKVDDYGDYLYLVVHGVRMDQGSHYFKTEELDIFIGKNYVLTFHYSVNSSIDECIAHFQKDDRHFMTGPDMLLAGLLEQLMDRYMLLMDNLDAELEALEDDAVKNPGIEMLERIIDLRHSISNLRRVVGPQRETIGKLSRGDFNLLSEKSRPYFRDVYDTAVRLIDIIETERDIAAGLLEINLSVASNKLNEIMRILMVVTVIIMPLTLITGIYGMNVKLIPMAESEWGFATVIVSMTMIAIGLALYFRRKHWL